MTIHYRNEDDFYRGVQELTLRGLGFRADYATLTITLTGGY